MAIKYFIKAYNYTVKSGSDDYKLKTLLMELYELYLKIDYVKSIECLDKILNWYITRGDIYNVIKTRKTIGDIYFDNGYLEESYSIYINVLEIINLNEKCNDVKRNIVEKICEIYYMKETIINLFELSKLYFSIVDDYLKKNIEYISARNFILNGLLMNLVTDDIVQTNNNFEMYLNKVSTFQNSREGVFISKIIKGANASDCEEITFLCAVYDRVKPLDKIQVKLLIKIKENLGFINSTNDDVNNDDVNNDDINNDDEIENDLC